MENKPTNETSTVEKVAQDSKPEQTVPAPIPEKSAWKINNETIQTEKIQSSGN